MNRLGLGVRLTLLNIAVMVVVLIPLGIISYQRESREMNHLLDGRLAQAMLCNIATPTGCGVSGRRRHEGKQA